jgi:hypothetical protein
MLCICCMFFYILCTVYHHVPQTFLTPCGVSGACIFQVTRASQSSRWGHFLILRIWTGRESPPSRPSRPPRGTNSLGGWPSFGGEGHQEEGRLQSLHMRMHAHVRAHTCTRTHTYAHADTYVHAYACTHMRTHTRTHKYTTHARMYVHNRTHTHACTQRTHTRLRTHAHVRAHTHVHTHVHAAQRAKGPRIGCIG